VEHCRDERWEACERGRGLDGLWPTVVQGRQIINNPHHEASVWSAKQVRLARQQCAEPLEHGLGLAARRRICERLAKHGGGKRYVADIAIRLAGCLTAAHQRQQARKGAGGA
jgi:hypothetical protein